MFGIKIKPFFFLGFRKVFSFKLLFFMVFYYFDVKNNFLKNNKNIILIYIQIKNIFKNNLSIL
jgi:hypothetical protein